MVTQLTHPLVQHHLRFLRDSATPPQQFRNHVRHLAILLATAATESLPLKNSPIETPMEPAIARELSARLALVPILRAGLGMADPIQELIPQAETWHLGFYRNETTLQPVEYYQKFSTQPPPFALLLDPMLATGGSAIEGINRVKRWGVPSISMLCIIAAPEGIERLQTAHPDVHLFTCAIDRTLNENAYILPGLGDAGDRIFNTL
jgi:uracil phosphoribosyltransferase